MGATGASAGVFAILAAHIGSTFVGRHELFKLIKKIEIHIGVKSALWWCYQSLAFSLTCFGIAFDFSNVAHHGGATAGFLMTLTLLQFEGVLRSLILFMWILATLVWVRIACNMEPVHNFYNVSQDAKYNASEYSDCNFIKYPDRQYKTLL